MTIGVAWEDEISPSLLGSVWIEERMCEDLRKWMCEDVWGKCEESESVWIRVC